MWGRRAHGSEGSDIKDDIFPTIPARQNFKLEIEDNLKDSDSEETSHDVPLSVRVK